jgi:hypothetical protein
MMFVSSIDDETTITTSSDAAAGDRLLIDFQL